MIEDDFFVNLAIGAVFGTKEDAELAYYRALCLDKQVNYVNKKSQKPEVDGVKGGIRGDLNVPDATSGKKRGQKLSLLWPPEFGSRQHPVDPGPRRWGAYRIRGETDEQAVFRRLPFDRHKPGGAE